MENVFLKLCIRDQTVNSEDENNNYVANNEIIERVYVNNGNNISKDNEESVQILLFWMLFHMLKDTTVILVYLNW